MDFPRVDVPKITPVYNEAGAIIDYSGIMEVEYFVGKYLKRQRRFRSGPQKGQICPTPHFMREMYYIFEHPEIYHSVIWGCPRGWGKSILTCYFSPLYEAVLGKRFGEQLIISSTEKMAQRWLTMMKQELCENEAIIRDFGELSTEKDKYGKWTNEEIWLANGEKIYACGWEGTVRGFHPMRIVLDDLENDKGAKSPQRIEDIEDYIRGTVMGMQNEEDAVIHWTGTYLEQDTALMRAMEGRGWDDSWLRILHKAQWEEGDDERHSKVSVHFPYKVGESIWPEKFSNEWLKKKESKMGRRKFRAEYQMDPSAKDKKIFERNWIRYYKQPDLPKIKTVFITSDLAVKAKEINDEYAFIVFGYDTGPHPSMDIFVLDCFHGHLDEASSIRKIIDLAKGHSGNYIVWEDVAAQEFWANALEKEMREQGAYFPSHAVSPKGKDKVSRAKEVSFLVERGIVKFREEQFELIDQLIAFPRKSAHDDMVDAFVYGLMELAYRWMDVEYEDKKAKEKEKGFDDDELVAANNPFPQLGNFFE